MLGLDQILEVVFDLSSNELEVIHDKVIKQFDVIVCDILNEEIILPTLLLPLSAQRWRWETNIGKIPQCTGCGGLIPCVGHGGLPPTNTGVVELESIFIVL